MPEKDPLARLIEDMSNSLHAEMQRVRQELSAEMQALRAEFTEAANRIEGVVERHSKQLTSGTLAIGAINRSMAKHDRMLKDLQARVRKLEQRRRRNGGKP